MMIQNFERVLEAIKDPRWDFRTVESLAIQTGLSSKEVSEALKKNPRIFRKCGIPDKQGNTLYTYADRPVKLREKLAMVQHAFKAAPVYMK